MHRDHTPLFLLPLLAAGLLTLAACGDDGGSGTAGSTATTIAATASTGGSTDGGQGTSAAPVCDLVSADDLAALFPGGTPGTPDPSSNSCTLSVTPADGGAAAFFSMQPVLTPFDGRQQLDTDLGLTISQLDGIGDRAYYVNGGSTAPKGEVVFERDGIVYSVLAQFCGSSMPLTAEPALQDTLMRLAAAWAATL